jgi:hypothetical protein
VSFRERVFALATDEIRDLAKGYGACIATDEIMVKGRAVGYAYRERPFQGPDSGWRFTAGDESDAYLDDPDNLAMYDVNTVANYDPEIIPLLECGFGWVFARSPETGKFECLEYGEPAYPTVEGTCRITEASSLTLPPGPFKRRVQGDSLVLWRRGFTVWISAWENLHSEGAADLLKRIRRDDPPSDAFDIVDERVDELSRYAYRLAESSADGRAPAFYGVVAFREGYVHMAVYFDDESDAALALALWRSVRQE